MKYVSNKFVLVFIAVEVAFKDTVYIFLLWNHLKYCQDMDVYHKSTIYFINGKQICEKILVAPKSLGKIEKSFSHKLTVYFIQGVRSIVFVLSIHPSAKMFVCVTPSTFCKDMENRISLRDFH